MGYIYQDYNGPEKCFNAAKSWQLGWYSDQTITLDVHHRLYIGPISGVVDYNDSLMKNPVLIKLDQLNSATDYYITFNARKGFNEGTREGGNSVMVVEQGGEGISYADSKLLATLSAESASFTLSDFDSSGLDATITVNMIDGNTAVDVAI
eukprot:3623149-Ditylum_brightwellii.AAC.1